LTGVTSSSDADTDSPTEGVAEMLSGTLSAADAPPESACTHARRFGGLFKSQFPKKSGHFSVKS
jgi:hypothetical protein